MTSRTMVLIALLLTTTLFWSLRSVATAEEPVQTTQNQRQLKINEFMASNATVLEDPQAPGKFPDWIELYNPSTASVSLDGLYLIKGDLAAPTRFAITDGLAIPAKGFTIFYTDNDPNQGSYHTNFKLKKEGDRIGLYADLAGTDEIDARLFGQQDVDISEGRVPDGGPAWQRFSRPTPRRSNTAQPPLIQDVIHSPELPTSSDAVTVTATISDDGKIITATLVYSIAGEPVTTVPMTTNDDRTYVGQIPARPSGAIVHYYVQAIDDEGQISPNPYLVRRIYRYPVDYTKPTLVINELMADNGATLEAHDDAASYPDWIELYNYGTKSVPLGGLFLTDKLDDPTKFAITDTLTIGPGEFLIFYADERRERGPLHTNFKLAKSGETVAIFGAEGSTEIDRSEYKNLFEDIAYGRYPDGAAGEQGVLVCVSPGQPNILCDKQVFMPTIISQ